VIVTDDVTALGDLVAGSHVCWVLDEDGAYRETAGPLLLDASLRGQKAVLLGPANSGSFRELSPAAAIAVDPFVAWLDRGPLLPDTVFAALHELAALASTEGYDGLRVIADMDWLLPTHADRGTLAAFEVLLDRVLAEIGATMICAYRRSSFDTDAIVGALSVHPLRSGHAAAPQFSLLARGDGSWRLAGEVDMAVLSAFAAAFGAAANAAPSLVVDVAELEFIAVAGLRTIAEAARAGPVKVQLRGARRTLRRVWTHGTFDELAPSVDLVV
jgi:hypothetical protein